MANKGWPVFLGVCTSCKLRAGFGDRYIAAPLISGEAQDARARKRKARLAFSLVLQHAVPVSHDPEALPSPVDSHPFSNCRYVDADDVVEGLPTDIPYAAFCSTICNVHLSRQLPAASSAKRDHLHVQLV